MPKGSSPVIELTVRACQLAAGRALNWWEPPSAAVLLEPFLDIPEPTTHGDVLLVRSVLSRFADRLGNHLHSTFHRQYRPTMRSCPFRSVGVDVAGPSAISTSAAMLLDEWLARYRQEFDRAHATVAQRARRYLERHAVEALTIADVAAALNIETRALQRAFLSETGLHLKEYQMRLRVATALPQLRSGEKIEAIAIVVGWKSKKDLYRATDRLMGRSPSAIRSMSSDALEGIIQQLHSVNRVPAAT